MLFSLQKKEWLGNIKGDVLAGLVVAFALIPEAIGFSIIAGVDPMIGLYASFTMAIVLAITGGRPAMISASTGAMALLVVNLVKDHGLEYLFATTILTGILQVICGYLGIAKLMKFIPRSVMIGFVNALAILIFTAQLEQFSGASWIMYVMVIGSLLILYGLPKISRAVPPALIAILVMTALAIALHLDLRTVGDMGKISSSLPQFLIPNVPWTFETLSIIFPTAVSLTIVGLLESLLTASIVDDMTGTKSDKKREAKAQGIGNMVTGFFGGIASCAMIGQSAINVSSGGRKRLSTFVAGFFLMFLIVVLGDWVTQIPMAVLVGVMITVSIGTFDWSSFEYIRKAPFVDTVVMILTVIIVVVTHNLAIGVIAGVVVSAILFMIKISNVSVVRIKREEAVIYAIKGQLFFSSVDHFLQAIHVQEKNTKVILDLREAHIWDDSGAEAVYKVINQAKSNNNVVQVKGLNKDSRYLMRKLNDYFKVRQR